MGRIATLALTLFVAGTAAAADHPFAGDKLVLKDPPSVATRRSLKFKATRDLALDPAAGGSPLALGATLEIVGRGTGDGTSGLVPLDTLHWVGLGEPPGARGYKWLDQTMPGGVRKVLFKPGSRGGSLTIAGKGSSWAYAIPQPQAGPIDVRLTIGPDVWCAHFDAATFQDDVAGKLKAVLASPPADCVPPPPPACGNGVVEGSEECDDGGTSSGDGCSATCELETTAAVCAGIPTVGGTALDSQLVATNLTKPLYVTSPRLDPRRIFIVEQTGHIRLVKDGALLPADFLDIHTKVSAQSCGSEQGLLGLAFDPGYETNGRFYVNYTALADGHTVVARYTVAGDPKTSDLADDTSESIFVTVAQPFANHNGGNLQFGPDDFLYVGMGDGGSGCDPGDRAQDDAQVLGKMLRIDVNAAPPVDPLDDVFAKGLRNPWRFSFDRLTGDLYIGDVGQNQREEIDVVSSPVPAGLNYGWDLFEGDQCSNALSCPTKPCPGSTTGFTMPIVVFDHSIGCSVTGGYVYRGCAMPDLHGTYFYSDYCGAFLKTFVFSGGVATSQGDVSGDVSNLNAISSFGEDARGELYFVVHPDPNCGPSGPGEVYKLVPGS